MADVTSYFSGPPLDLKNLPMNFEDPKKKNGGLTERQKQQVLGPGDRNLVALSPSGEKIRIGEDSQGQLPTAKPTSGPLPTVASVVAGSGTPSALQRGVDVRTPVQTSPLQDAAGKVKEFLTRQLTPEEAKQPTEKTKDLSRLKTNKSKAMEEFAGAFR